MVILFNSVIQVNSLSETFAACHNEGWVFFVSLQHTFISNKAFVKNR